MTNYSTSPTNSPDNAHAPVSIPVSVLQKIEEMANQFGETSTLVLHWGKDAIALHPIGVSAQPLRTHTFYQIEPYDQWKLGELVNRVVVNITVYAGQKQRRFSHIRTYELYALIPIGDISPANGLVCTPQEFDQEADDETSPEQEPDVPS